MIAVKTKEKLIKNTLFKHVYIFLYIDLSIIIAVKTKGKFIKNTLFKHVYIFFSHFQCIACSSSS